MTVFDFLQADNKGCNCFAGGDAGSSHGCFDLVALLTLQGEPPTPIFQHRQQSTLSRCRAFSQLADQTWITVALAFIKELDLITSKWQEMVSGQPTGPQKQGGEGSDAQPKGKSQPKRKQKGGGRGQSGGRQGGRGGMKAAGKPSQRSSMNSDTGAGAKPSCGLYGFFHLGHLFAEVGHAFSN